MSREVPFFCVCPKLNVSSSTTTFRYKRTFSQNKNYETANDDSCGCCRPRLQMTQDYYGGGYGRQKQTVKGHLVGVSACGKTVASSKLVVGSQSTFFYSFPFYFLSTSCLLPFYFQILGPFFYCSLNGFCCLLVCFKICVSHLCT